MEQTTHHSTGSNPDTLQSYSIKPYKQRTRLTRTPPSILCLSVNTIYTPMSWPLIGRRMLSRASDWLLAHVFFSASHPSSRLHSPAGSHSGPRLGSRKSRVLLVSSRLTFDLMSQCFNLSSVIIGLMREMWITDGARHELTLPGPGLSLVSRMWMNWWG